MLTEHPRSERASRVAGVDLKASWSRAAKRRRILCSMWPVTGQPVTLIPSSPVGQDLSYQLHWSFGHTP
jgi:hypothetical protein